MFKWKIYTPDLYKVATSPVLVTLVLHWTRITQNRRRAKLVEKTGFYGNHVVADSRKLTLKGGMQFF